MQTTTAAKPQVGPAWARPQTGTLAGIDIGRHSAKLVVVKRQPQGCRVLRASSLNLVRHTQDSGLELAKQLSSWLREAGEPGCRSFVATLPSSLVDYESVEVTAEPIADGVENAMREILGNAYHDASYDYWTADSSIDPNSSGSSIQLAWTSAKYASQLSSGLSRHGWCCVGIDVPAQALAHVATLEARSPAPALVVDVGAGEVSFVLADRGNCKYVRNRIQFAPDSAAGTISKSLGVDLAAAENLLTYRGVGVADGETADPICALLAQHLSEWLQMLTYEIQRTLSFMQHSFGANGPKEVVLCGGGACVQGLPGILPAALKIPVRFAQLPANCTWGAAERFSPLYAQALVSAMHGVVS